MAKAETRIVHKILTSLEETYPGSYFRKIHGNPFQHVGIPDIIGCVDGFFFGIEVKTESGKTSLIQDLEGIAIKKAGGCHIVACNAKDVINAINMHLKSV